GGSYDPTPTQVQTPTQQPTTNEDPALPTGTVRIEATGGGWAAIYLNGRMLGRTPLVHDLPVGRHRLRVMPYGHEPADVIAVDVEPGVEQSLCIAVSEPQL